jgi:phosphoribosyl 1,2-cyclic phosphodiesterase
MEVTFWGTRGTVPVPGPDTVKYGGNTACVSVRTKAGKLLILDAGTGIRNLGKHLVESEGPAYATLFLSHSHWDHIQGFPLFAPLYDRGFSLTVLGCPSHRTSLQEILARQQDAPVFPVPLDALHANIEIGDYCMDWSDFNGVRIRTVRLNHPGGSCGFRIEEDGRSMVFMTDNELPHPGPSWERFVTYCEGADLLIHDAQYTDAELATHRGWGHSSFSQAVDLAVQAGVKRLALFHHDPDRTDDDLHTLAAACDVAAVARRSALRVIAAAEGDTETV